jgi:phage terminase large subunit
MIVLCLTTPKLGVSIVRKSFPSLRGSILRDFVSILMDMDLYSLKNHNKTEQKYVFDNGSWVEFFSSDDEQKLRGRKRDILYCNEANELSFEEFNQLVLRTSSKVFIDFNPSDTEHWIYDLLKQDNSILIKSTYKDNPFLEQEQVDYIENLINVDHNYYLIYTLGERPIATTRIYSHFKQYIDEVESGDWCYGLDIGFNHPSALVKVLYKDNKVYVKELIYENKITISDLVSKIKSMVGDRKPIYCDSARPDVIEELKRVGLNANSSNKQVKEGIDYVKSTEVYIHYESLNLLRETKLYSWKSKGDLIYDEPIKMNDDAMDALRYALFTNKKKQFNSFYTKIHI